MSDLNGTFLRRSRKVFFYMGALYVAGVGLMTIPWFQAQLIYLHNVPWPLFPDYEAPHYYGIAPFKAVNLYLTTPDNHKIGAWFILSESAYRNRGSAEPEDDYNGRFNAPSPSVISQALHDHPTVLFFHGNAASRAVQYRVQFYNHMSTKLKANVLAIDYRGFGDSEGFPNEVGVNLDARTAWDWLVENGADPKDIIISGHSLGSALATKLASQLSNEGTPPRGLVIASPFSSIVKLLETYSFGGFLPLLRPLQMIPHATKLVSRIIRTRFETISIISDVRCPILIVHAKDDMEIPSSHSSDLFARLLEPQLPAWPSFLSNGALSWSPEHLREISEKSRERKAASEQIVRSFYIGPEDPPYAAVQRFVRKRDEGGHVVTFVELEQGGHSYLIREEGFADVFGWAMALDV